MGKRSTLKVSSLFGPPPVIEAGEAAAYDELYGRVCAAVRPVDVIYEMLIVDTVYLQLEIFRLRRWKSTWIQERGLEALHHFLSGLDYQHYRPRYAGYLEKALQGSLPNQQAPSLADSCAWNAPHAVDKANSILERVGDTTYDILRRAKADTADELTQGYRRREPVYVKFVDRLLAAAGKSIESLWVEALHKDLDFIERIDRLITNAENRRNAILREIDRRRDVLGQKRKSLHELEDNEIQVIEAAPAIQPKEKDPA